MGMMPHPERYKNTNKDLTMKKIVESILTDKDYIIYKTNRSFEQDYIDCKDFRRPPKKTELALFCYGANIVHINFKVRRKISYAVD